MSLDILQLTALQIIVCVVVIFSAYTIKGLSGFGSGLIAIPLLVFFMPLTVIVPLLGLLSYSGTIMQSLYLRKNVAWRDMLPLLPFSILGIGVAIWMLVNINELILIRALGVFVLAYSMYSLLSLSVLSGSRKWAILAGSFGGAVGALFGTGGPFYVMYLKLRGLDKTQFRATIVMIFLVDGGVRIGGYALSGLYTLQVLWMLLLLFPVLLAGLYVGNVFHGKVDQQRFSQIVSMLLMVSGVMLLYKSMNF